MCDLKSHFSHSMCSKLPIGDYSIEYGNLYDKKEIMQLDDSNFGYLINCNLAYSKSLKKSTADFPIIPTKQAIDPSEMISFHRDMYAAKNLASLTHVVLTQHD